MHTIQFCAVPKSLIRHQVYLHKFFRKAREIVFVIHVLFSSCYHVQKWQIPFAVAEKENLLQFASEWKFCSLIVTGVPIRLKRFIGQSLCLSKLLWALVRDKFRRQSIIIRVALHFEHRSLKSCFKLCLECSSPSSPWPLFSSFCSFHIVISSYTSTRVT